MAADSNLRSKPEIESLRAECQGARKLIVDTAQPQYDGTLITPRPRAECRPLCGLFLSCLSEVLSSCAELAAQKARLAGQHEPWALKSALSAAKKAAQRESDIVLEGHAMVGAGTGDFVREYVAARKKYQLRHLNEQKLKEIIAASGN